MGSVNKTAVRLLLISAVFLILLIAGNYRNITKSNLPQEKSRQTETSAPGTSSPGETVTKPSDPSKAQSAQESTLQLNSESSGKVKESDNLFDQGFEAYLDRRYDEAVKLFDKAIEIYPESYKAYTGKGAALCFKGKYKEGMDLITKALEIKPDYVYANFNMALAYKLKKDYNVALVWFDKAISYDSRDTWSYYGKACIYAEWNDQANAVENLAKAIDIDPAVKEVARKEPDLDNIKNNPEFKKLVK